MAKPPKNKSRPRSHAPLLTAHLSGGLKKLLILTLPYLLTLAATGALFGGVVAYALNSPAFRLEEVKLLGFDRVIPQDAFKFCELVPGENLISLDLVNIQQLIKRKHPQFKEVVVSRVLPNRIEVRLRRRTPVAQVRFLDRFVQVDRDLIVLPGTGLSAFKNLAVIEGASVPREGVFAGSQLKDASTRKAFTLLDAVRKSGVIGAHALSSVNASDLRNLTFTVDGAIEVRIGESRFIAERLKLLGDTLRNVPLDPSKVRYIDLRFDSVAIGPA